MKCTSDKDEDYALICANVEIRKTGEGVPRNYCTVLLCPHGRDAGFKARGGEGPVHRHLSLSVLMHSMSVYYQVRRNAYLYIGRGREIDRGTSRIAPYLVIHMYARADEECSFFTIPRFFLTLTPSYFARSRLVVAAADNATARMADSQLMCNPSCWRSLRF